MRNGLVLVLALGQSNSGIAPQVRDVPGDDMFPDAVHMLNDYDGIRKGGVRGWNGVEKTVTATDFVTAEDNALHQSLALPTANAFVAHASGDQPYVIARAEGRTGASFFRSGTLSLHRDGENGAYTTTFLNTVGTVKDVNEIAAAKGRPFETLYITFSHMEANNRDDRLTYLNKFITYKNDLEEKLLEVAPGLNITWLVDQAGGTEEETDGRNNWEPRLTPVDMESVFTNVFALGPRYQYPLEDHIHTSGVGLQMLGEVYGHVIASLDRGSNIAIADVASTSVSGSTVDVVFTQPVIFDNGELPEVAGDPDSKRGFTVLGNSVASADWVDGHTVRLTCAGPAAGQTLRYAYRENDPDGVATGLPVGRGNLAEQWAVESIYGHGKIRRYVSGFEVVI